MCGISGIWTDRDSLSADALQGTLHRMRQTMIHRGPDDAGLWVDAPTGVGLAHNRLSVMDLSPNGHQPMQSFCGRYMLAYNGEIYNFLKIRDDLKKEGCAFEGGGDTRVLVEAVSRWGLFRTIRQCNGMFAFALWDKEKQKLFLVRDRMGKKPLYYGWAGNCFIFASELKALRQHPDFSGNIDQGALTSFLKTSYVPAPYSIYKGIYKVMPGAILSITRRDISERADVETLRQKETVYWSVLNAAGNGIKNPFQYTEAEAVRALDALLLDAVSCRMDSDVPLGALFSGGIDSSIVVSLMQEISPCPVKTFTVGFSSRDMDEAVHAKKLARHLGTDHTEIYVTGKEAMDIVPNLPKIYDEPFADSSEIPMTLISKLARTKVTVALTGDGGDELFGGYRRYHRGVKAWKANRFAPRFLRHGLAGLIARQKPAVESKLIKFERDLRAEDSLAMYVNRITGCMAPLSLAVNGFEPRSFCLETTRDAHITNAANQMMLMDLIDYLPDNNLVKVDRASMSASLELRSPFLDYRVVEFAWRLPLHMKMKHGKGKIILKTILNRHAPQELTDRPKRGFGAPVADWLAGDLREWAEAMLSETRLRQGGLLNPDMVRSLWSAFLAGRRKLHVILWNILMFQAWSGDYPHLQLKNETN